MKDWNYPKSKEEFVEILENIGIEYPDVWKGMEFNDDTVSLFFFLYSLWHGVPNPNKADEYLNSRISHYDRAERIQESNKKYEPPSINIFREWLKQGIKAEDICTVVRDAEIDAIYRVFGSIEHSYSYLEAENIGFGLYRVDIDENFKAHVPEGRSSLEDEATSSLLSAMPEGHPPMPQWC